MKLHPRHNLRCDANNAVLDCILRLQELGLTRSEVAAALAKQLSSLLLDSQSGPRGNVHV